MAMMSNRVGFIRILVAVMLITFIAAPFAYAAEKQISITVSVWSDDPNPSIIDQAKEFEKLNPNVKVEVFHAPNKQYLDKILALIATGMAPDVIKIDGYYFSQIAKTGALLPLEKFTTKDKRFMDGFFPHTFMPDHQIYNGTLYGIPNGDSARALFFNSDAFRQAGVELPTAQSAAGRWDWNSYVSASRKLTQSVDGIVKQYGTQVSGDIRVLINWTKMNGGELLNEAKNEALVTSQDFLGALDFQASLYRDFGVTKPGLGTNQFVSGQLATMINGIWASESLLNVPFEWDAGPLPSGKNGLWSVYKPNSYTISRTSPNTDTAWEFIKFLTGDESEAKTLPEGTFEVKRKANARYLLNKHAIPNARYFLDMIANGRVFSLPVVPEWAQIEEAFNKEWRDIRDGKQSAQVGMIRAKGYIDAILHK